MVEVRYRQIYKDGKLIAEEPYEVSDEEIILELAVEKIKELTAKPRSQWTDGDLKDAAYALTILTGRML